MGYEKPSMEIMLLAMTDVIKTSPGVGQGEKDEDNPDNWTWE